MIKASKARTIQMLKIGQPETALEQKLLDEFIKGEKNHISTPIDMTQELHDELVDAGYSISYSPITGEYEISWRKTDGN